MQNIKCPHCDRFFSIKGIGTHMWRKHGNGINHKSNKPYNEGRFAWNKGLTKDTDERVKKFGETYSNNVKNGITIPSFLGKHHTLENIKKFSLKTSLNNKGGKCKWFEIINPKGEKIKVQGTWERDFCKVLNIIDENWIKIGVGNPEHSFKWIDLNNKEHYYTPDFWCPKLQKYFEVKGYWWGEDKRKVEQVLEQHKINLEIVKKKELDSYLKLIGTMV